MAAGLVRVWADPEQVTQHLADPPGDDTSHRWDGTTVCGVAHELVWIHPEQVDGGLACPRCTAVAGTAPPLEGDHPGPV